MGNSSGCLECFDDPDYVISIKTGDTKGVGLHNSAHIILVNERGEESRKIQLSGCCVTVFKKGKTDSFNVKDLADFGRISEIIVEQHKEQHDVEWYIEKINVIHVFDEGRFEVVFPINRWLRMDKPLRVSETDSFLPRFEKNIEQRRNELKLKRMVYSYRKVDEDLPAQMNHIPRDEVFSNFYKWDVHQKKNNIFSIYQIPKYTNESWKSLEEIECVFKDKGKFRRPKALDRNWQSDLHFAQQRLRGCNSRSLCLCEEIPKNFVVTEVMVEDFLEGFSLNEVIEQKRLFIVNHSILDGLYINEDCQFVSPVALFYLTKAEDLIPIAIQLYQQNYEEKSNPVFLPNDPYFTWMLAKMWFNNADAIVQRICFLFTLSHWILECISLSINRCLSPSHPIFRFLAPYHRLVLAINHFEMRPQLCPGGWADQTLTIKQEETIKLIKKQWNEFDFQTNCCLKKELEINKVLSAEVIAEYPYRDDGLLLYGIIENYVQEVIDTYYTSDEDLLEDNEIQMLAAELVSSDSCGYTNVPGDGSFEQKEDLVTVLTCIIYKATVEHAALTLPLYDECAFVPNYPLLLRGEPPRNKDSLTEEDVMLTLPDKRVTMEIIAMNKLISERDASGLADTRSQFQHDAQSTPTKERFDGELRAASALISIRNRDRKSSYDYLNPGKAKAHMS